MNAPSRSQRPAIISLYALENNGTRHVSSALREEGFQVTEVYFKDWVNNNFPWPTEQEVQDLINLLRERQVDGFFSPRQRISSDRQIPD